MRAQSGLGGTVSSVTLHTFGSVSIRKSRYQTDNSGRYLRAFTEYILLFKKAKAKKSFSPVTSEGIELSTCMEKTHLASQGPKTHRALPYVQALQHPPGEKRLFAQRGIRKPGLLLDTLVKAAVGEQHITLTQYRK